MAKKSPDPAPDPAPKATPKGAAGRKAPATKPKPKAAPTPKTKPKPHPPLDPKPVPAKPPSRFAGLDGLRAIAVITVILFHLTPGAMPGGFLGVDIFFVLSGFLITALLVREHDKAGRIDLLSFWRRRARRLLPAIGVLVLVCCSVALAVGGNVLVGLGRQVLGAATFSSNWLSIANGSSYFTDADSELFRNLWSLAVEEQFYLIWPLVILALLFVRSTTIRAIIVGALALASVLGMALLYTPGGDATRVYYGTDTHSFGLAIGATLALASKNWSPSPLEWPHWLRTVLQFSAVAAVLALIVAAFVLPADADFTYQGGLLVVAVLAAIAIAGAIVPDSTVGRLLDVQPMRWIGERSYGLYLWHWPAFVLTVALLPTFSLAGLGAWALGGIALLATVVPATLSYRYIEQPIRINGFRATLRAAASAWTNREARAKQGGKLRTLPRLTAAVLTVALVIGGGLATGFAIALDPGETDAQAFIEAGQAIAAPPPASVPVSNAAAAAPAAIPGGDQISAVGDSVMLASASGLSDAFPGIVIDAAVSRSLSQAPGIVSELKAEGNLRPTLLLGLGTNGPIDMAVLEEVRQILGPDRQIVVVSAQAPRWWIPEVNETLEAFARRYRNVELANWQSAISGRLDLLARDQVHPGEEGGAIYASTVREALQRLAELPPLLSAKEYGLAPYPSS